MYIHNITNMEIQYQNKHIEPYVYMPFLLPSQTQNAPNIKINDIGYKYYTLIMYDPDAVHGTYMHWVVANIVNNNIHKGNHILEYTGPNPPDVKQHRYIFQLYGSNQKWKDILFESESRNFSLEEAKKRLDIKTNPIIEYIFVSQREKENKKKKGGTKTKRKTKCTNKKRKYKSNKYTKRKYRLKYNKL